MKLYIFSIVIFSMHLFSQQVQLAEIDKKLVISHETLDQILERISKSADLQDAMEKHKLTITNQETGEEEYFFGHTDKKIKIVADGDYKICITSSLDKTVRIWNREERTCRILTGFTKPVTSIMLSSDGNTLITGSEDGLLISWDLKKNKKLTINTRYKSQIKEIEQMSVDLIAITLANNVSSMWNLIQGNITYLCDVQDAPGESPAPPPLLPAKPIIMQEQVYPGIWRSGTKQELDSLRDYMAEKLKHEQPYHKSKLYLKACLDKLKS